MPDVEGLNLTLQQVYYKHYSDPTSKVIHFQVAPDRYSARYTLREVGVTISGQRGPDDDITVYYTTKFEISSYQLSQCKFDVGDYIDVVINQPDVGFVGGRGNGAAGSFGLRRPTNERQERERIGGGGGRYGR